MPYLTGNSAGFFSVVWLSRKICNQKIFSFRAFSALKLITYPFKNVVSIFSNSFGLGLTDLKYFTEKLRFANFLLFKESSGDIDRLNNWLTDPLTDPIPQNTYPQEGLTKPDKILSLK